MRNLREFRTIGPIEFRSEGLDHNGREVWVAIYDYRMEPAYMEVLGQGYVLLDSYMASDEMVVNSARVIPERKVVGMANKDVDLIHSMMEGRHGTPFEHEVFRFIIKVPIFVIREWHRHRMCSYNEISMRWMKGEPEFYVPTNVRQVKAGARKIDYNYEDISDDSTVESFKTNLQEWHEWSYRLYEGALEAGIAPEQARYYLPNTFFTVMVWTVNARSLMNFLSLRAESHAMYEMQVYAEAVESHFKRIMPITHAAFEKNGRRAP